MNSQRLQGFSSAWLLIRLETLLSLFIVLQIHSNTDYGICASTTLICEFMWVCSVKWLNNIREYLVEYSLRIYSHIIRIIRRIFAHSHECSLWHLWLFALFANIRIEYIRIIREYPKELFASANANIRSNVRIPNITSTPPIPSRDGLSGPSLTNSNNEFEGFGKVPELMNSLILEKEINECVKREKILKLVNNRGKIVRIFWKAIHQFCLSCERKNQFCKRSTYSGASFRKTGWGTCILHSRE